MAVFTSAGIATFLGVTAGVFTAGAAWILNTIVGIGLSYLLGRLAGEPEVPGPSVQGKLQGGGDVPRSFIIGEYITAGSLVYANFWGNVGKTPNAYFTQVIALSDIPVKGLNGIEVSGESCTLLTGEAHSSYGYPVQEYRKDGTDYLWVKFYDGNQTVADPFLVSRVGSVDRPYSSNRVGKGVAYAIVTSRFNDELFSGFPTFKFIVDGVKLYDITKDTTAGGSGTQRWNDPNTWGGDGDYLTGVAVYNLLRGIFYDGDWVYGLQLTSAYSLPSDNWLTQIGKCRTPVDGPDGSEPSYRMGAEVNISIELKRNIDECLTTCNGRISEIGGVYKLFVGAPDSPVVTIYDDDILSTESQRNVPFFGLADTINGMSARYPNPAEGWNIKPAPSIYRTDLEAAAGGRRLMADINFTFCPYIGQVQRVSNAALLEAQRARRHTITLPPKFWKYEAGDIVTLYSTRNGYVSKDFRLDGTVDKANLDQIWDITEIDPSDYSWNHNTDFKPVFDGPINPVRPGPAAVENFAVYQYSILDSVSAQRRPAIRLVWNGVDQDGMDGVAYEVRLASDESYVSSGTQWNLSKGEEIISENLLPNEGYEVRAKYVRTGSSGTGTPWSTWKAVTTPNLLINSQDIFDSAIITSKLADAAITNAKILDAAIDDLKIAANAVTEAKIAVGAVTTLKLGDLAVTTAKIGIDAVTSAKIQDAAIIASKIQDEAVTALKLGNAAVTEAKIAVDAVTSAKIQDLAITNAKIVNDAVTSAKILDSAIIQSKIAAGAVTGAKIAAATIDATKIASGAAVVETLPSLPNTGNFEGRMVYLTTDEKLYRHKGTPSDASGFTASVDTVDLSGTVNADQIADNAVTIAKLLVKGREDSLILDPVFEDSDLWENPATGNSAYVEAINSSTAYKGGKVLSFDWSGGATGSSYYWDNFKVPIDPNKTYLFEVVARKLSGTGTFYGVWRFFKADGSLILDAELPNTGWDGQASDNSYRPAGVNLSTSWERFTLLVGPNGDAGLAASAAFVSCGCLVNYPGTLSNTQIGLFSIREATVNELLTAGSIDASKIAAGAAILEKVATLPNTGNFEGRLVYLESDEKVYRHKGTPSDSTGFISTTAASDVTGQLISSQLADLAVTTEKIANLAITTGKIPDSAVIASKVATNAITSDKIVNAAIVEAKLGTGAVTNTKLGDNAVSTTKIVDSAIITSKLNNLAVATSKLADAAITTLKLNDLAVTEAKVATNAISSGKIVDAAIITSKLNDSAVTSVKIVNAAITDVKLASAAVTEAKVATSAITETKIADNSISTGKLQANSIVSDKIAANAIIAGKIASNAVTASTILAGAVVAGKLATDSVVTANIQASAITTAKLDALAITADKIASNAVTSVKITSNAITATHIQAGAIVAGKIAAGVITATELATGSVTTAKIVAGAVTATEIASNAITAAKILSGAIETDKLAANAITADKVSANAITSSKLTLRNFANLVPNPSFETGDSTNWLEWSNAGAQDVVASTNPSVPAGAPTNYVMLYTGTPSAIATFSHGVSHNALTGGIEVKAGERYLISIDAAASVGFTGSLYIYAYFTNTAAGTTNSGGVISVSTSWQTLTREVTVPAGYHKMIAYILWGTPSTGYLAWTNVQITRRMDATLIVDGAIVTSKLDALAVSSDKINANAVTAGKIAANAISATEIQTDAITSNKILAGAITTVKIDALAVSSDKIAANAITAAKIAALTITADQIASNAITSVKINTGAIVSDKIATSAITSDKIAANAIIAGKVAAGVITATEIASGAIVTSKLAVVGRSNAINPDPNFEDSLIWTNPSSGSGGTPIITQSVAAPAGTNVLITAGPGTAYYENYKFGIDDSKTYLLEWIAASNGTGTFYGIHRFFNGSGTLLGSGGGSWSFASDNHYWPSAVTLNPAYQRFATQIGANTDRPFPAGTTQIALGFLGNNGGSGNTNIGMIRITEVTRGELIVDGAVIADKIATNAVTSDKIVANAITSDKIVADAITSVKIAAGTIVASDIASGTITALQIASNAITSDKIAANAIVADKIASNAVTSDKIIANAITTGKIAAGAITATQIATGAIIADKIAAGVITSDKLYVLTKNLINDASIEGTTAGWTPLNVNQFSLATHTIPANPFNKSYLIKVLSGNSGRIDSDLVPIKPDETYRLQVTVYDNRTANGNTGTTYIGFWLYDEFLTHISAEKYSTARISQGTGQFNYFWYGKADGWKKVVGIALGQNTDINTVPEPIGTVPELGFIRIPANARYALVTILNYSNNTDQTIFAAGLSLNEVTTGQIVADMIKAGQITASKIAAGTITGDKIAATTITGANLVAGTITASQIATGTITATQIATGAITAIKIAAGTITGDKIAAATITGTLIAASTIGAGNIAAGAITTEKLTVVARSGSINPDPNFEDGTLWTNPSSSPSNPYTVSSQYAPVGTRVLMVPAGNHFYDNYKFGIDDTKTYLLEWIAASSGTGTFYGVLRFFDGVGTQITSASGSWSTGSGNYYYPSAASLNAAYQRFAIAIGANTTHPLPSGTTQASLGMLSNLGGTGLTNIGMVRITEMARGELIVDGAVTAASVAANAITGAKIAAGTITAANIAAATITGSLIAAGTIAAGNIAAGAVTADKVSVANLAAISATLGAVNISSAVMGSLLVGSANIANAAITSSKVQKLKVGKI